MRVVFACMLVSERNKIVDRGGQKFYVASASVNPGHAGEHPRFLV